MKASKIIGTVLVAGLLTGCSYMGDKHSVYFNSGSSVVTGNGKQAIAKMAKMAKKDNKKVKLIGYTDNTGSKKLNKRLSKKRIAAVNNELIRLGVKPMKISGIARGEGIFDKKNSNSRKKRRVELRVY